MPSAARSTYVFSSRHARPDFIYISIYTASVNSDPIKNNPALIADYSHKYINPWLNLFSIDVFTTSLFYFLPTLRGHRR